MKNKKTTVSIVIPTYNRMGFLIEAIESVKNQTYKDFELIIVDDGSTDGTSGIVSQKFPDTKLIIQKNKGVSCARNVGIKNSIGGYIAFLDSDDLWVPEKLETQMNFFDNNPKVSICQTEELWVRNGKRVNPKLKHKKYSGWIFNECIPLCIVSPSAVMIKRKVFDQVGLFDENLPACEDYDLWLRIALEYEIVTLAEPLIVKRGGHQDQLSKQWGLDAYRIKALEKILGHSKISKEQAVKVKNNIKERCEILIKGFTKRENRKEVEYYKGLLEKLVNNERPLLRKH